MTHCIWGRRELVHNRSWCIQRRADNEILETWKRRILSGSTFFAVWQLNLSSSHAQTDPSGKQNWKLHLPQHCTWIPIPDGYQVYRCLNCYWKLKYQYILVVKNELSRVASSLISLHHPLEFDKKRLLIISIESSGGHVCAILSQEQEKYPLGWNTLFLLPCASPTSWACEKWMGEKPILVFGARIGY